MDDATTGDDVRNALIQRAAEAEQRAAKSAIQDRTLNTTLGADIAAEKTRQVKVVAYQLAMGAGEPAGTLERAKLIYGWLTE